MGASIWLGWGEVKWRVGSSRVFLLGLFAEDDAAHRRVEFSKYRRLFKASLSILW
jgi:hypothetical protein